MRLGAYILPGDPVWMRSSLSRYYDRLDDLVVLVPRSGLGWRGTPLPVKACLDIIEAVDTRRISRIVLGDWQDVHDPLRADTAQRLDGVHALKDSVDWILQLDNDEVIPDPEKLMELVQVAEDEGFVQVDWPLRTLYRRAGRSTYLEVCSLSGETVTEFAPVAVKAGHDLAEVRRADGPVLRVAIKGDDRSLLLVREPEPHEHRMPVLGEEQAIIHNSWGRSPREVWAKTRSWGHYAGLRGVVYYLRVWLPAKVMWRSTEDFHPFSPGLWPRLRPFVVPPGLLHPLDER